MESNPATRQPRQFSIRFLFVLTGLIAISLVPLVYLGWLGIPISILIAVSGVLVLRKRYSLLVAFVIFVPAFFLLIYPGAYLVDVSSAIRFRVYGHCMKNLRQIAIAILEYETVHKHYPPPYTTDANGKPLHSWRVLILPYLGEQKLYDQIDLTKSWDHPKNLALAEQMPRVYRCPHFDPESSAEEVTTAYVAFLGDRTAWPRAGKRKHAEIVDGHGQTLLVVESEGHRLHWMSPGDPGIESIGQQKLTGLHPGVIHGMFCDGSIRVVFTDQQPDELRSLLTIDRTEKIKSTK